MLSPSVAGCLESDIDVLHAYSGFGLSFQANRVLGELRRSPLGMGAGSLEVRWGNAPTELAPPRVARGVYQATAGSLLLNVPSVARYHIVKNGITVTPEPGATEETVRLFLFGSAMGALLHLNGILALHGSAVRLAGGGAAVFCGVSTAGKSTLAAALSQQGFRPLADDIVAVHFDADGQALVYPGLSYNKLWGDALSMLDLSSDGGRQVRPNLDKYSMPVDTWHQPERLTHLYELLPREHGDVSLETVKGLGKLRLLDRQTFRPAFIDAMDLKAGHLSRLSQLLPQVQVRQITRPRGRPTLPEIIDLLKADWM